MERRAVRFVEQYSWLPFLAIFLAYVVQQVRWHDANFGRWDFLVLSGWATLALGLALAQTIPRRLDRTLHRLRDRGSIDATDERLAELLTTLRRRAHRWGLTGAALAPAGVVIAFAAAARAHVRDPLLWLEIFGGLVAGYQLGRGASYASLGSLLKRQSCTVKVTAGHFDGAAGLKPIGEYYFFQAMVAGIPAAFLAVWWLIIPVIPRDYGNWRNPYLGPLVLAIAFELLCFFIPILYFHREMERQQVEYLREADRLSSEMAEMGTGLANVTDPDVSNATKLRIAEARERYELIDSNADVAHRRCHAASVPHPQSGAPSSSGNQGGGQLGSVEGDRRRPVTDREVTAAHSELAVGGRPAQLASAQLSQDQRS